MAETRHLCLCADDFGLSPGINAAVLALLDQGQLSATGCLVLREAWNAGSAALRRVDPHSADVGLHLDLTPPPAPSAHEAALWPLIVRGYTHTASCRRLRENIAGQFARFEDRMGRAPAFVDGHRHVHQLPVVRQVLLDELARRYGDAMPWLRNTAPRAAAGPDGLKAHVVHALGGAGLARAAARRSVPLSHGLLGVYGFTGGADAYRRRLHAWLNAARSGDVLMCHPSIGDRPATPHDAARTAEYAVLAAVRFPWITPGGDRVVPAPFSQRFA